MPRPKGSIKKTVFSLAKIEDLFLTDTIQVFERGVKFQGNRHRLSSRLFGRSKKAFQLLSQSPDITILRNRLIQTAGHVVGRFLHFRERIQQLHQGQKIPSNVEGNHDFRQFFAGGLVPGRDDFF